MVRLLTICVIFLLLYAGFSVLETMNSPITVSLYDYQIKTTIFFSAAFVLFSLIIIFILIKLLISTIKLPLSLITNIISSKKSSNYHLLLQSMGQYIIGNKTKAAQIIKKTPVVKEYEEFKLLLCAEVEEDLNQKITYFQTLTKSKEFKYYSFKNLALIFYKQGSYNQAEHYALMAYDLNEHDAEVLEILIYCYFKMELWTKFTFVVKKLAKIDRQKLNSINNEVGKYYFIAAKSKVAENDFTKANKYLEDAINLNLVNPEILELYFDLNEKLNPNKKIELLKNSFKILPDIEIVKLFQKATPLSNQQIYQELETVLDYTTHAKMPIALPLAIELYLEKSYQDKKEYKKMIQ